MLMRREQAVPSELATTTFGPVGRYVAANDNFQPATHVAAGFTVDSAGNLRSLHARQHHRAYQQSVAEWRASTDRTMSGLAALQKVTGYIYLGSPYSKCVDLDKAAREVAEAAGALMNMGHVVYSPIAHGHALSAVSDLPQTWDFWRRQCDPMIDAAAALIVLTMDGWQESVGLTYEIATFLVAQKPILYLSPSDVMGSDVMGMQGEGGVVA